MKLLPTQFQTIPAMISCSVLLLSRESFAAADEVAPALPIGSTELLDIGGGLIVVILAIIVLGVIYAKTQGLRGRAGGIINIIATQAIGPKERIALVQVANKQLLVGMTTTAVQTLHVFDEPIVIDAEPRVSFSDRLRSVSRSARK